MEKVHLLIVIVSPIPTLARHARQAPWAAHGRPPARLLSWPSTLSHAHQSPVVAASHVREGKRVLGTYLASPLMTSRACVCVCVCVLSVVVCPPPRRCAAPLVEARPSGLTSLGATTPRPFRLALCLLQPVHPCRRCCCCCCKSRRGRTPPIPVCPRAPPAPCPSAPPPVCTTRLHLISRVISWGGPASPVRWRCPCLLLWVLVVFCITSVRLELCVDRVRQGFPGTPCERPFGRLRDKPRRGHPSLHRLGPFLRSPSPFLSRDIYKNKYLVAVDRESTPPSIHHINTDHPPWAWGASSASSPSRARPTCLESKPPSPSKPTCSAPSRPLAVSVSCLTPPPLHAVPS